MKLLVENLGYVATPEWILPVFRRLTTSEIVDNIVNHFTYNANFEEVMLEGQRQNKYSSAQFFFDDGKYSKNRRLSRAPGKIDGKYIVYNDAIYLYTYINPRDLTRIIQIFKNDGDKYFEIRSLDSKVIFERRKMPQQIVVEPIVVGET